MKSRLPASVLQSLLRSMSPRRQRMKFQRLYLSAADHDTAEKGYVISIAFFPPQIIRIIRGYKLLYKLLVCARVFTLKNLYFQLILPFRPTCILSLHGNYYQDKMLGPEARKSSTTWPWAKSLKAVEGGSTTRGFKVPWHQMLLRCMKSK